MSEKQLKEIKDSIDFQERITKEHDFDMTFLQEEIDLYNEVVRLQHSIAELNKINEEHRKLNGELRKENEELQKQLDIKNNGFMASIDETCEYATVLTEFEKWLEAEILKMGLNDFYALGIHNCYDKLQELKKEGKK